MSERPHRGSMSRLLQWERVALAMLALLLVGTLLYDAAYRALWILGPVLIGLVWLVALLLAGFGLVFAWRDPLAPGQRVRAALAMPAALVLALMLAGPVSGAGRWLLGYAHLRWNETVYEAERRRAGPDVPLAFPYLEGIPDGGVAIVDSPVPPAALPPAKAARLTGEPLRRCRPLRGDYHLCEFD